MGAGSAHTSSSLDVVVIRVAVVGVNLSADNAVVVRVNPYLNSVDGLILEMLVLLSAVVVVPLKVVVVDVALAVVAVAVAAALLARVIDLVDIVRLALHLLRLLAC